MKHCKNKSNLSIVRDYLSGTRPITTFGYEGTPDKQHKEGEEWTDKKGITWIKTKTGKISKHLHTILEKSKRICPVCKKDIFWAGNHLDSKFFNMTGKCYDCVIEEENQMRIEGTYETYEKIKIINNQYSYLKELKQKLDESLIYLENPKSKLEFINEDGTIEEWPLPKKESLLEDVKKDHLETTDSLKRCEITLKKLYEQFEQIKQSKQSKS